MHKSQAKARGTNCASTYGLFAEGHLLDLEWARRNIVSPPGLHHSMMGEWKFFLFDTVSRLQQ
ncbi:MAG: hypothetical protein ACI9QQ_002590 [Myxococcota bacterium]|jgi:hypothetical protein